MPNPVTALGRYLTKRKDKRTDARVVSPERTKLLSRANALRQAAGQMGLPGLQASLDAGLDTVAQAAARLDALDTAARTSRLMQLAGAVDGLEARMADASDAALSLNVLRGTIGSHRQAVATLKDATERARLEAKLVTFERGIAIIVAKTDPKDLAPLRSLVATVRSMRGEIDIAQHLQSSEQARLEVAADLPALRLRIVEVRKLEASSPAMKSGLLVVSGFETGPDTATTAGDHLDALVQLKALTGALAHVEALAANEAKAYADALKAAEAMFLGVSHGVVKNEALAFKADYLTEPVRLAAAGDRHAAIARLGLAETERKRISDLIRDYADKLVAARAVLIKATPNMVGADVVRVETTIIAASIAKAQSGERQAALNLLAKVAADCALSERANLKAFMARGKFGAEMLMAPLKALAQHLAKDEFAAEIATLQGRLDRFRNVVEADMNTRKSDAAGQKQDSFAEMEAIQIHVATNRQRGFADSHVVYAQARIATEANIKALQASEPAASNAALVDELKAIQDGLAKAGRQAGKRTYDLAMATLKTVDDAVTSAATLKAAHAAWVAALALQEPRVENPGDVPDTPGAAEAQAMRTLLARARTLAAARDFAGANALMKNLRADFDAYEEHEKKMLADRQESNTALADIDTDPDTALAEVRKLLTALKQRAGHEGIGQQIAAVEGLLAQAETALTA